MFLDTGCLPWTPVRGKYPMVEGGDLASMLLDQTPTPRGVKKRKMTLAERKARRALRKARRQPEPAIADATPKAGGKKRKNRDQAPRVGRRRGKRAGGICSASRGTRRGGKVAGATSSAKTAISIVRVDERGRSTQEVGLIG